jgi:hypothetical protein
MLPDLWTWLCTNAAGLAATLLVAAWAVPLPFIRDAQRRAASHAPQDLDP